MATPTYWRFQLGAIGKVILLFVLNGIFSSKTFAQFCPMTKRYMTGGIKIRNLYDGNRRVIDPNKDTSFAMKVFFTKEGKLHEELEIKFKDVAYDNIGIGRHRSYESLGRIVFPYSDAEYGIYYSDQPKGVKLPCFYRIVIRYKEEFMVVDLLGFMQENYLQKGQLLEPKDPADKAGILDSLMFQPGYFQLDYSCNYLQRVREHYYKDQLIRVLYIDGLTQHTVPLLLSAGCLQYIPDVEQSVTKELEFDRYSHEIHEED